MGRRRQVRGGEMIDLFSFVKSTGPLNLPLWELGPNQCRFIEGDDHLYCGRPADGSWCPAHRKIVYRGAGCTT